jgi:hypothetical protein
MYFLETEDMLFLLFEKLKLSKNLINEEVASLKRMIVLEKNLLFGWIYSNSG